MLTSKIIKLELTKSFKTLNLEVLYLHIMLIVNIIVIISELRLKNILVPISVDKKNSKRSIRKLMIP